MSFDPRARRLFSVVCIALSATTLVGCDEAYVNTRQEAESYKQSHPQLPGSKIFIQQSNGSEVTLDEAEEQDSNKQPPPPEPTMIVVPPLTKDETGEVLKYEEPATQTPVELFSITSIMAVNNGATSATMKLDKKAHITELTTYHWNDAKGKEPGTIRIKDQNGKTYGPWQATSLPGQGGVQNAYWKVTPNIDLPVGSYTVVDSDPATWSQNSETKGQGMMWAKGW